MDTIARHLSPNSAAQAVQAIRRAAVLRSEADGLYQTGNPDEAIQTLVYADELELWGRNLLAAFATQYLGWTR